MQNTPCLPPSLEDREKSLTPNMWCFTRQREIGYSQYVVFHTTERNRLLPICGVSHPLEGKVLMTNKAKPKIHINKSVFKGNNFLHMALRLQVSVLYVITTWPSGHKSLSFMSSQHGPQVTSLCPLCHHNMASGHKSLFFMSSQHGPQVTSLCP